MTTQYKKVQIPCVKSITVMEEKEIPIYIANDGEVFFTKRECVEHELLAYREQVEASKDIRKCASLDNYALFSSCGISDPHSYKWFSPLNQAGADLLCKAYPTKKFRQLTTEDFGKWFCIGYSYTNDMAWWSSLDACLSYSQDILSHIKTEIAQSHDKEKQN